MRRRAALEVKGRNTQPYTDTDTEKLKQTQTDTDTPLKDPTLEKTLP